MQDAGHKSQVVEAGKELVVRGIQRKDRGEFICTVNLKQGTPTLRHKLEVLGRTSFTSHCISPQWLQQRLWSPAAVTSKWRRAPGDWASSGLIIKLVQAGGGL